MRGRDVLKNEHGSPAAGLWLRGQSGDQAGELSQVQVMKGPLSHVWTYPEDKRTHQRVLSRGRTGLIRDFPGSDEEDGVETE